MVDPDLRDRSSTVDGIRTSWVGHPIREPIFFYWLLEFIGCMSIISPLLLEQALIPDSPKSRYRDGHDPGPGDIHHARPGGVSGANTPKMLESIVPVGHELDKPLLSGCK